MRDDQAKVFLSYARPDAHIVRQIYARLREENIPAWLDSEDIKPGEGWEETSKLALRRSKLVLILLMCPDIMSTGFAGAESGTIRIGDTVAVFAQGPLGLCATAGAKLSGATTIIGVDRLPARLDVAKRLGADIVIDASKTDPVEEIMRLTNGRGVDVAIEALGTQATFEAALRVLRPGGTLSCLGVYSKDLTIPLGAFSAGLGDNKIVTSLCPGGKERMRRLMSVIASGRIDLQPMVTHRFKLDQIEQAYELFGHQRDGVLKVAITP